MKETEEVCRFACGLKFGADGANIVGAVKQMHVRRAQPKKTRSSSTRCLNTLAPRRARSTRCGPHLTFYVLGINNARYPDHRCLRANRQAHRPPKRARRKYRLREMHFLWILISPLPQPSFSIAVNNQPAVTIKVFEGERGHAVQPPSPRVRPPRAPARSEGRSSH